MIYTDIDGIEPFSLNISKTFDCGQCFRFDDRGDGAFFGVAFGRYAGFRNIDGKLRIYNATRSDFDDIWRAFLALDCNYAAARADILNRAGQASAMEAALNVGAGIRILQQDTWEALCSFIISQNNNIPRIKKIISAMCEKYGEKIETPDGVKCAFPSPEALFRAGTDEIYALKTGFRAKYIFDAAEAVSTGRIDLTSLRTVSASQAEQTLLTIRGVGPKVAACSLLFGAGKTEMFPIDVWIKRVLAKYFPTDFDPSSLGEWAGLAQQYLFYYERYMNGGE